MADPFGAPPNAPRKALNEWGDTGFSRRLQEYALPGPRHDKDPRAVVRERPE